MTRFRYLAVFMVSFLLFSTTSGAVTCDYKEKAKLNNEAANVKGNYEIKERELSSGEYVDFDDIIGYEKPDSDDQVIEKPKAEYFQINIMNLTEDLYLEVTNNKNSDKKIFTYSDAKDGNISFDQLDTSELVTYTVRVFSSNKTNCADEELKILYVALPRYNQLSDDGRCNELEDYYLCERYVTFEEGKYNNFSEKIDEAIEDKKVETVSEEKESLYNKVINYVAKNKKWFIIGGITLVVTAGAVTIVIKIKRRRDVL